MVEHLIFPGVPLNVSVGISNVPSERKWNSCIRNISLPYKREKKSFVAKWVEHKIKFKNDLEEKSLEDVSVQLQMSQFDLPIPCACAHYTPTHKHAYLLHFN